MTGLGPGRGSGGFRHGHQDGHDPAVSDPAGTVVDYLGRYSHRIALSDSRLMDFNGTSVQLSYEDERPRARFELIVTP